MSVGCASSVKATAMMPATAATEAGGRKERISGASDGGEGVAAVVKSSALSTISRNRFCSSFVHT
jgi:hypothetical protein